MNFSVGVIIAFKHNYTLLHEGSIMTQERN